MIKTKEYWSGIDSMLETLVKEGFVKLPTLKHFDLNSTANKISIDMKGRTFTELCQGHEAFISQLAVSEYLVPKLFKLAKNQFNYKGNVANQYHIARRVEAGNEKEMYRAHFDSHLFTLVLPIKIPAAKSKDSVGELIYFPNIRQSPSNEFTNIIGKLYHKQFASKQGIKRLSLKHHLFVDDFKDYRPLLFIGNRTLHTNLQVSSSCSSYRLTLLAHFFDPSPKYGIGKMVRLVRNR